MFVHTIEKCPEAKDVAVPWPQLILLSKNKKERIEIDGITNEENLKEKSIWRINGRVCGNKRFYVKKKKKEKKIGLWTSYDAIITNSAISEPKLSNWIICTKGK